MSSRLSDGSRALASGGALVGSPTWERMRVTGSNTTPTAPTTPTPTSTPSANTTATPNTTARANATSTTIATPNTRARR